MARGLVRGLRPCFGRVTSSEGLGMMSLKADLVAWSGQ